jgi:hypothetical protein
MWLAASWTLFFELLLFLFMIYIWSGAVRMPFELKVFIFRLGVQQICWPVRSTERLARPRWELPS